MRASSTTALSIVLHLPLLVVALLPLGAEALASGTAAASASSSSSSKILRSSRDYHLMEEVPHDTTSFTQGLTYFDGHIYEGTGMEKQSSLMRHDPNDGMKTLDKLPLEPSSLYDGDLFGEGITHYHVWKTDATTGKKVKEHRLIQLTWKNKVAKVYTLPKMELIHEFTYDTTTGEGWGITFMPQRNEFFVSDGSEYLHVWDAETFVEKRKLTVTFEMSKGQVNNVQYVNELEFVDFAAANGIDDSNGDDDELQCTGDGTCTEDEDEASLSKFTPTMKILANLWYQDVLVAIDPQSGKITRVYDMMDIYPKDVRATDGADCFNGISLTGRRSSAKNGEGDDDDGGEGLLEIWVTGKLWPKMYRIRLID